jgi:hypothetical protein
VNDKKRDRLFTAIEWSKKQLHYPRKKRYEAIKQYVGHHYSEEGTQKRVPVNFLKLAIDVYVRALAAKSPRVLISTRKPELMPTAANLELAVNEIPDEIGLNSTLRKWVTEALFSLGVLKVGLYTAGKVLGVEYGEPFVDIITLDDYFLDMSATSFDEIQFEGNYYWPIYEDIMNEPYYDKKLKKDLKPDEGRRDENGSDRAENIMISKTPEEYKKRIHLRDVWLPTDGIVVTYSVSQKKIIKEIEWDGPKHGMYHKLWFTDVPGNLMPLPSVAIWRDLHELGNALFRKLSNQGDSQKNVLGFSGENEDEVNDFKHAKDGDGILYKGQTPKTLAVGGVDARTLAFYMQVKNLSSYFAGNIDALGGLAAQSETLGQDRLISGAASAMLRDMSARTVDGMKKIFNDLCYYEWNDPINERNLVKSVPEFPEIRTMVRWNKESKKGKFSDYNLDIDVYSMVDDSPQLKLQKLNLVMQQYIQPLMPEIQRQGGQIDVQEIFRLVAKYSDFPELHNILFFMQPGAMGEQQQVQSQYVPKPQTNEGMPRGKPPTNESENMIMQMAMKGQGVENG